MTMMIINYQCVYNDCFVREEKIINRRNLKMKKIVGQTLLKRNKNGTGINLATNFSKSIEPISNSTTNIVLPRIDKLEWERGVVTRTRHELSTTILLF